MKNRETLRKKLVRFFYSVKGWRNTLKMTIGDYYVSKHIANSRFMWRGNRTFYKASAVSTNFGAVYTEQKKVVYKYWEIGILDFKKG